VKLPTRRDLLALPLIAAREGEPPLAGTFLQFWAAHLEWPPARWNELFGYLRSMRVRELVIQWSGYDGIDFTPLVERVLAMAEPARMNVKVGLRHESSWWKDVDADPAAALRALEQRAAGSVTGLTRVARQHGSFAGWYVPEEIDDSHWREASLAECLKSVRGMFRPLSVSGFSNRALPPRGLAEFWRSVARGSGVDEVLFQDGVGAGKMPLDEWPGYAAALHRALGRRLTIVVETFEQRGQTAGFQAGPAPLQRVLTQCQVAHRHGGRPPVAFSLPEYYTPLGGDEAGRRYKEYLLHFG